MSEKPLTRAELDELTKELQANTFLGKYVVLPIIRDLIAARDALVDVLHDVKRYGLVMHSTQEKIRAQLPEGW